MKQLRALRVATLFGAALLLPPAPALAGNASVGTTAATVVAAKTSNGGYRSVTIANQSASATISCTDDGTTTPVIGAAGSYDIAPGLTRHWGDSSVEWQGPFQCVASAAATPVSYTAN